MLAGLLLAARVMAAPELVMKDQVQEYALGQYIGVLEDPGGTLTIDDVSGPEYANRFRTFNEDRPVLGYSESVFWIRLNLHNGSSQHEWLLSQNFANTHFLDLYLPGPQPGTFTVKKSGSLRPYAERDVPNHKILFRVPIEPGADMTVYLRYQSEAVINLSLQLWSATAFVQTDRGDYLLSGVFFGSFGLIMLIVIALFQLMPKHGPAVLTYTEFSQQLEGGNVKAVEITDGYRTWWSYIPHFMGTPGYVYAYAYGQLLALSVYRAYEERGDEFVPQYLELLAAGGSRAPEELGQIVGLDLADPGFWSGGLEIVAEQLDAAEAAAKATGRL